MRSFCLHNFSFWSVFSAQRPECPSVLFRALYIHTHSYSFGIAACGHHDWLNLPLVAKHGDSSHSEPVRGEVKVLVAQCPTLCNPMDCSCYRILQARILEWVVAMPSVAISFSRGSSPPRGQT